MNAKLNRVNHSFDVCVIGGGMSGLCAAIAAARRGAKTCLVHDRPVYGGNASSEVRMWICGAHGKHNKETGILEEIQLENAYRNGPLNYSIWDSVLYGKAHFQPNLTPLLNCSVADASCEGDTISSVTAWQLTSQTWHHIEAKLFIDCSGDGILAGVTPAAFRTGRESREEFGEDIQPQQADEKTMGNSLLIQLRRTEEPQPFTAPSWAYKFESPEDLPKRIRGVHGTNFWWLEVGGLQDTIRDAEPIRDELMRVVWGVWDYIKNRAPERDDAANWALEWIGALPGKRENRRFEGEHIMTQHDVRKGEGNFQDVVAYGGWSMDDHHPAGIYYPGKPTIFHPAPSPYGIPLRSLYSKNLKNLMFAGRNISVTHAALSSTRVMATCALIGQAAGTAAAQCVAAGALPREIATGSALTKLQQTLLDDDCWLPGLLREADALAADATFSSDAGDVSKLTDGLDRDREDESHAWEAPLGTAITCQWSGQRDIGGFRLTLDSNLLSDKRMPASYPQKASASRMPDSLVKAYRIEVQDEAGSWQTVHQEAQNTQRLVRLPLKARGKAIRFVPEATWGAETARVFAFEPVAEVACPTLAPTEGPTWSQVVKQLDPADLAEPDSGLEATDGKRSTISA